jgi:hypothetical protein
MSTSAAACPKCGAPRDVALSPSPKSSGKFGTLLLVAVIGVGIFTGYSALFSGPRATAVADSAARPVKRIDIKAEYLRQVALIDQAMTDMNVDVVGTSIDAMVMMTDTFSLAARLTNQAAGMSLAAPELALVNQMGKAVVRRQLQAFPLIRENVGPILAKKTWEADVTVTTKGKRFDTMEFVGRAYAANRNIAKSQEAMFPVLMKLRFKHSDYRWADSAPRSASYTINSPGDGELVSVSADGAVTTTLASL